MSIIDRTLEDISGKIWDTVNEMYQHDYHIFDERDTDFLKITTPDESGKVVFFEVPGKDQEVVCAAAGLTRGNVPAARFSLWLLDAEDKEIRNLKLEVDVMSVIDQKNPMTRQRRKFMIDIYEEPQIRFYQSVRLTARQGMEWRIFPLDSTVKIDDIKKVVFKGEFDVWVKKDTNFGWWDYEQGKMRGLKPGNILI